MSGIIDMCPSGPSLIMAASELNGQRSSSSERGNTSHTPRVHVHDPMDISEVRDLSKINKPSYMLPP